MNCSSACWTGLPSRTRSGPPPIPSARVVREAGDAELDGDLRSDRRLGQQPPAPEAPRLEDGASRRHERPAVAAHGRDRSGEGAVHERRREPAEHDLDRAGHPRRHCPPARACRAPTPGRLEQRLVHGRQADARGPSPACQEPAKRQRSTMQPAVKGDAECRRGRSSAGREHAVAEEHPARPAGRAG